MHVNRPFPHYGPVNKHKEMRTRLGWTISYKSLYFVHPSLELMPLFTEMRERSIEKETFFFLNISWDPKFPLLIVLIERFARKFGHQTARQNTGQGCKKAHFRLSCVRLKTSFKLSIKMLNNINMQNVVSPLLLFTWPPKPASRARLLNL